jgi:hypothetical protein
MAIVYSRAWEAKIVTSAYWVHHDQVSKTAPSGEYLTTGSFMVRGKKNYLPPTPLLFGFGILFRVADECIPNHMHERRPHLRGGGGSNDDLDSLENANTASVINESPQSVSVESLVENSEMMQADDGQDITASSDSDTESESSAAKQDNSPTDNAPLSRPNDPAAVVVDKYNLQDFGASSETDDNNQTVVKALVGKDSGPARKYVSAKQRRRMKKGSGGPSAEMNADDSDEGSSNNDLQSKSDKKQQQQQQPVKQVRGKKGKLKRLERYKDQDEEERQLRMQLLGASEIKTSKLQLPVEDGKDDKAPQTKQQDDKSAAGKQGRNKPPAAATKQIQVSAKEQRDATAASATAPGDDETAEINRLLGEENLLPPDEDDPATLIDTLTGTPLPTDTIMFAVPTCAPLATIQSYKYRVKLIPGAMKKGKAARAALAHFSGMSDSPAEKAVMKAVTESELIQTMLGKVKVMLSSDNANKKRGKK